MLFFFGNPCSFFSPLCKIITILGISGYCWKLSSLSTIESSLCIDVQCTMTIIVWWLSVTIVTMVDKGTIFGMIIPWDLTFKFSLGATSKNPIWPPFSRWPPGILKKLWAAKWNCCQTDKSVIFGKMIPCKQIFYFGLGATLKKSNMAAIFKMATRYYIILTIL